MATPSPFQDRLELPRSPVSAEHRIGDEWQPHQDHREETEERAPPPEATAAPQIARETPAARLAVLPKDRRIRVEHPSGVTEVSSNATRAALSGEGMSRTARKLMDGVVFARG
ncbi:hypothetical protein DW2_02789 [Thioclava atlantica]|uniref:Uncharacterized protein n=1 Tax=Thioclava atlantica TaxID=1317124 RepID=A0A085TZQ5_9RHOB|nr:hypothetical protein DW2_02789 [Thioclava atlantica]